MNRWISMGMVPGRKWMRCLGFRAKFAVLGLLTAACAANMAAASLASLTASFAASVTRVGSGIALFALLYLGAAFRAELLASLAQLRRMIDAVGAGNLCESIEVLGCDDVADAGTRIEAMTQRLSQMVARSRSESELIAMAGRRLTTSARELASRTEAQAANLQQTATSVTQLNATTARSVDDARAVTQLADRVREGVDAGVVLVDRSLHAMNRIEAQSRQMREIVAIIDGIAFQTNILALNAAVESARAGAAGRGFAVVASEVRVLAHRSAQAATGVKKLIDDSTAQVAQGVESIGKLTSSLANMAEGVRETVCRMHAISLANEEQATSLNEISAAVTELERITQSNATMADAALGSAEKLHQQAELLGRSVGDVRLRQGCADEAKALVERAAQLIDSTDIARARAQFHSRDGGFIDRDLFVFVLDRENYFRAFGANPAKADHPAVAAPGTDIAELCARIWYAADRGGDWIEYRAPHPATNALTDKIGYALSAAGGRYAVVCAVNRAAVQAR
ncbi:methyl-accepting chemotaxis protein [Trinickia acidisoli]|uniref:methyl-accepting chemotaxis protein n=1 Tax=Trinickia acidisoli TaxID=2767482 RepID=UPI001A8E2504|nr:methyl-accepting chemotaxis protein [Trinickia acidisoli]